jgi:hypothetical protein
MYSAGLYLSAQVISRLMFRSSLWLSLRLFFIPSVFSVKSLTTTHSGRNEGGPSDFAALFNEESNSSWTRLDQFVWSPLRRYSNTRRDATSSDARTFKKLMLSYFLQITHYMANRISPFVISFPYSSSTTQLFIIIITITKNWCRDTTYIPIPHSPPHHKKHETFVFHNNDTTWWTFVLITCICYGLYSLVFGEKKTEGYCTKIQITLILSVKQVISNVEWRIQLLKYISFNDLHTTVSHCTSFK